MLIDVKGAPTAAGGARCRVSDLGSPGLEGSAREWGRSRGQGAIMVDLGWSVVGPTSMSMRSLPTKTRRGRPGGGRRRLRSLQRGPASSQLRGQ